MAIIAIDPGVDNTGLVYMSDREVIDVKTIHYMEGVKTDQRALMERSREIAERICDWMLDKPHDALVVEGFVTFRAAAGRSNPYSFQTPYLCGVIGARFEDENIIWQLSRDVLNPRIAGSCAWVKDKVKNGYSVLSGDERCSNDHLRSALAHGVYYFRQLAKGSECNQGKSKGSGHTKKNKSLSNSEGKSL